MKSKVKCHLKLLIFHRRDAGFHGEPFFAAWDWARSPLLPEPHSSARPQECLASKTRAITTTQSQKATLLCSDSRPRRKSSRPISGSSITNSEESRTAKNRAELGIQPTPKH